MQIVFYDFFVARFCVPEKDINWKREITALLIIFILVLYTINYNNYFHAIYYIFHMLHLFIKFILDTFVIALGYISFTYIACFVLQLMKLFISSSVIKDIFYEIQLNMVIYMLALISFSVYFHLLVLFSVCTVYHISSLIYKSRFVFIFIYRSLLYDIV